MKIFVNLIFLLLLTSNCFSQERKVKLAVDVSNNFMKCFTTGRFFNLSTAGLGIDVKTTKLNMRLYSMYGFNTNIGLKSDVGIRNVSNFAMKGHFLEGSFETYFSTNSKSIKPYFSINILSEIFTNYYNGNIYFFYPIRFKKLPIANEFYQNVYGANFYQSTPLLIAVNSGTSFRIAENLRLNISIGYNLNVMNYKYAEWTKNDDRDEMIRKAPMQKKALHSIAGQIGLSYVFSFKKEAKTEMP